MSTCPLSALAVSPFKKPKQSPSSTSSTIPNFTEMSRKRAREEVGRDDSQTETTSDEMTQSLIHQIRGADFQAALITDPVGASVDPKFRLPMDNSQLYVTHGTYINNNPIGLWIETTANCPLNVCASLLAILLNSGAANFLSSSICALGFRPFKPTYVSSLVQLRALIDAGADVNPDRLYVPLVDISEVTNWETFDVGYVLKMIRGTHPGTLDMTSTVTVRKDRRMHTALSLWCMSAIGGRAESIEIVDELLTHVATGGVNPKHKCLDFIREQVVSNAPQVSSRLELAVKTRLEYETRLCQTLIAFSTNQYPLPFELCDLVLLYLM
jgi:hypothetical protein